MQANFIADKFGREDVAFEQLAGGENTQRDGNGLPVVKLQVSHAHGQAAADDRSDIGDDDGDAADDADENGKIEPDAMADFDLVDEPYAACEGADALVVVTEWKAFWSPDFRRLKRLLKQAVIFDGRNIYDPTLVEDEGLAYYGIGRGRSLHTQGAAHG